MDLRSHLNLLLASLVFVAIFTIPAASQDTKNLIERAYVDSGGSVHVVDGQGKDHAIPKEKEQVEVVKLATSQDRKSVGWAVSYKNCCTSYPIPLVLVIYRDGRIQRLNVGGLMLYDWKFSAGGQQVAFCTGTVHSAGEGHCALHDAKSGRKLANIDGPLDGNSPEWVRSLHNQGVH